MDHTFKETAKKFGIHHSTVSGWVKESEKQDKCANFGDFFREKGRIFIQQKINGKSKNIFVKEVMERRKIVLKRRKIVLKRKKIFMVRWSRSFNTARQ